MRKERGNIAKRVTNTVRVSGSRHRKTRKEECLKRNAKAAPESMNTYLKTLADSPGM